MLQSRLKKENDPVDSFVGDAPQAIPPEACADLVHEAVQATGIKRKKTESIEDFARRCLQGKSVAVIDARYGMLQKVFELFGAKTYGMDIDPDAVRVCQQRNLETKRVSAEEIHQEFADRKPDFVVSWCFFDKYYWGGRKEQEAIRILEALRRHSSEKTIHLHQTYYAPVDFPGYENVKPRQREIWHMMVLKAGPV